MLPGNTGRRFTVGAWLQLPPASWLYIIIFYHTLCPTQCAAMGSLKLLFTLQKHQKHTALSFWVHESHSTAAPNSRVPTSRCTRVHTLATTSVRHDLQIGFFSLDVRRRAACLMAYENQTWTESILVQPTLPEERKKECKNAAINKHVPLTSGSEGTISSKWLLSLRIAGCGWPPNQKLLRLRWCHSEMFRQLREKVHGVTE